ncbi:MAG: MHYT domain-containing protein [Candidatus Sericytochromatia bacterium]
MFLFCPVLVGVGASYTALELTGRMTAAHGRARAYWLIAGSALMGLGIWSMHFIGMLAFHVDMLVRYDIGLTLVSLAIAIAASSVALGLASQPALGRRGLWAGGVFMGLAIAAMHYTGMAAMRLSGIIEYQPVLFGLSVIIAIGASVSALWLAFWLRGEGLGVWSWRKIGSAVVMGAGISGMHYTGMAATIITSADVSMAPTTLSLSVSELDAVVIGFCSLFVLAVGLLSFFKEHLQDKQTALEASQRQLAAIVESSGDAIMSMTLDGTIISWNPAAEQLFGYSAAEAIGQPARILSTAAGQADSDDLLARLQRGEAVSHLETTRRHCQGHRIQVSLSVSPIRDADGTIVGISSIARDIGERKRAEAQAARWAARLAEANARLREADRHKDEFLSVISHELRTPLNFITGFASVLDDEVPGPLNALQRTYVGKILTGADRMLLLVNDLLDAAKLQAGKFDLAPQPTEYLPVIEEVVTTLRPLADRHGLRLDALIEAEAAPFIDGPRIVQVLTNLVGNAIKFTPQGGRVTVRAFLRGDELVTQVMDTGRGISPENIPRLFQRFQQLDMSATRDAGGTGLGLTICKALVEAHGGAIGVLSEPGRGSTFWFTLPMSGKSAVTGLARDEETA